VSHAIHRFVSFGRGGEDDDGISSVDFSPRQGGILLARGSTEAWEVLMPGRTPAETFAFLRKGQSYRPFISVRHGLGFSRQLAGGFLFCGEEEKVHLGESEEEGQTIVRSVARRTASGRIGAQLGFFPPRQQVEIFPRTGKKNQKHLEI